MMITVAIMINGNPIMARSAVNKRANEDGTHTYRLDDGQILKHRREDGAVALAIAMLRTIPEDKQ